MFCSIKFSYFSSFHDILRNIFIENVYDDEIKSNDMCSQLVSGWKPKGMTRVCVQ